MFKVYFEKVEEEPEQPSEPDQLTLSFELMSTFDHFYKTREDGAILVKTSSPNNCYIRQVETGRLYSSATDVGYKDENGNYYPSNYTYELTNIEVKKPEEIKPKTK